MRRPAPRTLAPTRSWREAPIDAERALRATELRVAGTASRGVYVVSGGAESHWVNFAERDVPLCDCADHEARDLLCKHAVAVLLWRRDRRARRTLRRALHADADRRTVARAQAATAAYLALATAHGVVPLPVPWRRDAAGAWWRPVRDAAGRDEDVVVTFVPDSADVRRILRCPF